MADQGSNDTESKRRVELPMLLFALIALVAIVLPSRERDLFPFGKSNGFLAQSASSEALNTPFGSELEDPVRRIGLASVDRSTRPLNPVLRAGGAAPVRSRLIDRAGNEDAGQPGATDNGGSIDPSGNAVTIASGPDSGQAGGGSGGFSGGAPLAPIGGGVIPFVPETVATVDPEIPVDPETPTTPAPPPVATNPVPEPATWMLLILGFGLIGRVARRRSARLLRA